MKHLLILIFGAIIFLSCHKDNPNSPTENNTQETIQITYKCNIKSTHNTSFYMAWGYEQMPSSPNVNYNDSSQVSLYKTYTYTAIKGNGLTTSFNMTGRIGETVGWHDTISSDSIQVEILLNNNIVSKTPYIGKGNYYYATAGFLYTW